MQRIRWTGILLHVELLVNVEVRQILGESVLL